MARIDKATIDKILDVTNIVDVVSDFVSLKKRGSSFLGLCPFHNERTPSFSVSASRGIFKCFSCGKAGNAVSFLMDLESMSYVEAIKWLGKKYNIEVKEKELTSAEKEAEAERESLFAANDFALKHFESTLKNTDDGRQIGLAYFRERGISDAMIERFHLGYALDVPDDLYKKAQSAGFSEKYLVETGLCIKTDRGSVYDRFKGRVIYPVHSLAGRVVAFGGRTLRKEKTIAKYVNSPESKIYSKSKELYGIFQARNAIAKSKKCILVEGYMDVISMHQAGVENVVASSGTSLTEGQIKMIKRFAENVTLIYDSDAAGIKASLRGIDMLIKEGLNLKIVLLPEGDDPDSFAQSHTSEEVEAYIAAHEQDLIGFKSKILLEEAGSDPRKRSEAINDILQSISMIPDVVEQSLYMEECAKTVGVNASTLGKQLKLFVAKKNEAEYEARRRQEAEQSLGDLTPEAPQRDVPTPPKPIIRAERDIIKYVLRLGFMYLCPVYTSQEASEPVDMSVFEYLRHEFNFDGGYTFSDPFCQAIWDRASILLTTTWPQDSLAYQQKASAEIAAKEQDGIMEIRRTDADLKTIMEIEKAFKEKLDKEYQERIDAYSAAYVHNDALRSDDAKVIAQVASLTSDNVVLSKMYPRTDPRTEAIKLLPIVVNTLRSAIVKDKLQNITQQIKTEQSPERLLQLMEEFKELKQKSMDYDHFNGEIVITP